MRRFAVFPRREKVHDGMVVVVDLMVVLLGVNVCMRQSGGHSFGGDMQLGESVCWDKLALLALGFGGSKVVQLSGPTLITTFSFLPLPPIPSSLPPYLPSPPHPFLHYSTLILHHSMTTKLSNGVTRRFRYRPCSTVANH